MEKILKVTRANLRRHKKEAVLLGILIMLCMMLLSSAISAEKIIDRMFPDLIERTGAYHNVLTVQENEYPQEMLAILKEDEQIERCELYYYIKSSSARITDKNGKRQAYPMQFMTEENERLCENFTPDSSLSDAEIAAMEHSVYISLNQKQKLGLQAGDIFSFAIDTKQFRFTVAGFFESMEMKFIVNDADYAVLKTICDAYAEVGSNIKNDTVEQEAPAHCLTRAAEKGLDLAHFLHSPYMERQIAFTTDSIYMIRIIEIMAVIILIAVAVMIGYTIVSDIRDQIVNIGVLEALGYRSIEIAGSYALEYLLIALAGCISGTLLGILMQRVLVGVVENMKGCTASHMVDPFAYAAVFTGIILVVLFISFMKARSVRYYPPVLAFRKGIQNHHFGKSHFPLRKTRSNVHLRLGLKGFANQEKQNIGLTFVMAITTFAVVLSFILYSFLGKGVNVIRSVAGQELSDLQITAASGTDMEIFCAELETMPEIRKVLATTEMSQYSLGVQGLHTDSPNLTAVVYDDFSETENIHPAEGRLPKHENEIMVSKQTSSFLHIHEGDSVILEYNGVSHEYIVCGIVNAMVNPTSVYITSDGFRLVFPLYQPDSLQIYKSENTDTETLRAELDRRYGKSAENLGSAADAVYGSYEERVRARAQQLIASMMEQNGATNVEYTIRCGDMVISGNSSSIRIRSFLDIPEQLETELNGICVGISIITKLFTLISALVVMMILWILMESEIRRQRRELGIMKGMGYTARELMLQLAFRIMPAALIAVVTGSVLAVLGTKLLVRFFGGISVPVISVLFLDAVILAFCFLCAYVGARKIKQISVYELMTE